MNHKKITSEYIIYSFEINNLKVVEEVGWWKSVLQCNYWWNTLNLNNIFFLKKLYKYLKKNSYFGYIDNILLKGSLYMNFRVFLFYEFIYNFFLFHLKLKLFQVQIFDKLYN